jgi:hypothetical protein
MFLNSLRKTIFPQPLRNSQGRPAGRPSILDKVGTGGRGRVYPAEKRLYISTYFDI